MATLAAGVILVLSARALALPGEPRTPPDDPSVRGERLYRRGVSASGAGVEALVQGDLRVRSTELPCEGCHRRSGWGGAEGPVTVPPIVGSVLFAPVTRGHPEMGTVRTTGKGTRAAYDDATLLRALREGIDPAGRPLSPSMPRYMLSDEDGAGLVAYLRSLSGEPAPGVDAASVHLATVITPGVDAARRASMLDVLRTYVRHKNAGTRDETRRREHGPWDMAEHYRNYRSWVLHEWELRGSPDEWPAQLAALYGHQPVFALLSGLAADEWTPIHEFCEGLRLPAVLPQAPLPPQRPAEDGFYSLYFSRGLALEAETLAARLTSAGHEARVLQVSRCGTVGEEAAALVARVRGPAPGLESRCLDAGRDLTGAVWREWLQGGADALVLWLGTSDVAGLEALAGEEAASAAVRDIYLSSTLLGETALRPPPTLVERVSLLSPFVAPNAFAEHAWRSLAWMKANGVVGADRPVAVNALYAATLVADALSHPGTLVSREYFVERIEHMASRSPTRSAYAAVGFGPTRRFASSACGIVRAPGDRVAN